MLGLGVRLLSRLHPYNLIVTNVPGPQVPLYLLGARLLAGFPQVPLFENQGLGIALFSYCGSLGFGFNADREVVADLNDFATAVSRGFIELKRRTCRVGYRPADDPPIPRFSARGDRKTNHPPALGGLVSSLP